MSPNTPETELKNVGELPSSFISILGNVALRNKKSLAAGYFLHGQVWHLAWSWQFLEDSAQDYS